MTQDPQKLNEAVRHIKEEIAALRYSSELSMLCNSFELILTTLTETQQYLELAERRLRKIEHLYTKWRGHWIHWKPETDLVGPTFLEAIDNLPERKE